MHRRMPRSVSAVPGHAVNHDDRRRLAEEVVRSRLSPVVGHSRACQFANDSRPLRTLVAPTCFPSRPAPNNPTEHMLYPGVPGSDQSGPVYNQVQGSPGWNPKLVPQLRN